MIRRLNRLLVAFLVVALSLYVVILNREPLTLFLTPHSNVTAPTGVLVIAIFCLGIICSTTVAVVFGVKSYLRERGLLSRERQREAFFQMIVRARSHAAAGEQGKAREIWQQILRRDPKNIIARIELSRSLEADGEIREALKILDAARSTDPENIEILFRAAELNIELQNKTAAVDNLALILYHHPVARAARMARDLSEELGRVEDAIEYHTQLEKLTPGLIDSEAVLSRLEFKRLLRDSQSDATALSQDLKTFLKRNPESVEALVELASLETKAKATESAAQLLVRAARHSRNSNLWQRAMQLWIENGMPERALATARAATKDTQGTARIDAELNLARAYLSASMPEEAKSSLAAIPGLAQENAVALSNEQQREILVLKSLCFNALGNYAESAAALKAIEQPTEAAMRTLNGASYVAPGNQPPPRLSTP